MEYWMPTPPKLHSGKRRNCTVCSTSLKYTSLSSWDEYLVSDEYLRSVHENLYDDSFISSLLCGDSYCGDLPAEHRLHTHSERRQKLKETIVDSADVVGAGIRDQPGKRRTLVRNLEELWLHALPTSAYTMLMERRLAIVYHASKLVIRRKYAMSSHRGLPAAATGRGYIAIHQLAIKTLSALLKNFKHSSFESGNLPIQGLRELVCGLRRFDLREYWMLGETFPEKPVPPDAMICSVKPFSEHATNAIDGGSSTHWESSSGVNEVEFVVSFAENTIVDITSITIEWRPKCQPERIEIYYKTPEQPGYNFMLNHCLAGHATLIDSFSLHSRGLPLKASAICFVMYPPVEADVSFKIGIVSMKIFTLRQGMVHVHPRKIIHEIETWLFEAVDHMNDLNVAVDIIRTLRSWCWATGTLSSVLRLVQILLSDDLRQLMANLPEMSRAIQQECSSLVTEMEDYNLEISSTLQKSATRKCTGEVVLAMFDSAMCSSGTAVEETGSKIRSREASYQHGVVDISVCTGKSAWEFKLDEDTRDDEMTCFGAAVLPVSVSSYDSSPNMWMLRGYNGNLYARGEKLSRSIGKVHPGDIVRIEVDMDNGTMSYAINSVDYGVVFTDLSGHDIHPAVSFYGTGKAVSLTKMELWNTEQPSKPIGKNSNPGSVPCVFLSSLTEYESFVGRGKVGRGSSLGYENNLNRQHDPPVTGNQVIQVCGKLRKHSLSTHPPTNGVAYIIYDINSQFMFLEGKVAINDDIPDCQSSEQCSHLEFSIWADGISLWTSMPLYDRRQLDHFKVDISNVETLELRVYCSGDNNFAHAIWVDPFLISYPKWKCQRCSFVSEGYRESCKICFEKAEEPLKEIPVIGPEDSNKTPLSSELKPAEICDRYAAVLLRHVVLLGRLYETAEMLQLDEPLAIEPCAETFSILLKILVQCSSQLDSTNRSICIGVMRIIELNFARLNLVRIDPEKVGIKHGYPKYTQLWDASPLVSILECLAGVHISNPLSPVARNRAIERVQRMREADDELELSAADAIVAGFGALYPGPADRIYILLTLLRGHQQTKISSGCARFILLSNILKRLCEDDEYGTLTLSSIAKTSDGQSASDLMHSSSVCEVLSLIFDILSDAFTKRDNGNDDINSLNLSKNCEALLIKYQRQLLAEAIQIACNPNNGDGAGEGGWKAQQASVESALIKYSELLISKARQLVEITSTAAQSLFTLSPEKRCKQEEYLSKQLQQSVVGKIYPWFCTGMCILRRRTRLTQPLLTSLVRILQSFDALCSVLNHVGYSESRLKVLEVEQLWCREQQCETQPMLQNVFSNIYTGDKDHFDGQIGFRFEATSTFVLVALGRSTNLSRNNGILMKSHTIRLWEEVSEILLAECTVDGGSEKDDMGYVFKRLRFPLTLMQGRQYRITTYEYAQSGDPWYKKENLPDEEYDSGLVRILQDCYAAGSTAFPSSQNLASAAYGVPTFFVEKQTSPLSQQHVSATSGASSVRFDNRRRIHHLVFDLSCSRVAVDRWGSDKWETVITRTTFIKGKHGLNFRICASEKGSRCSGNICLGIATNEVARDRMLGTDTHGVGWMPRNGTLWNNGKILRGYSNDIIVSEGDVIAMIIDFDDLSISFAYNCLNLGVAFRGEDFIKATERNPVVGAVSLFGNGDSVEITPGGFSSSTMMLDWLLDTLKTSASLAGRFAGAMIAGSPIDTIEEELLPWLQSNLLSGGVVSEQESENAQHLVTGLECGDSNVGTTLYQNRILFTESGGNSIQDDNDAIIGSDFFSCLATPSAESPSRQILSWLEQYRPDTSTLRNSGRFYDCECPALAAMLRQAPLYLIQEAAAAFETIKCGCTPPEPSIDMICLLMTIRKLRHWLIKSRHEYRARTCSTEESLETPPFHVVENGLSLEKDIPPNFVALCRDVQDRAQFLCTLMPATRESHDRIDASAQLAIARLAEKWSAERTPAILEPMVERWKSLSESDCSKWSGVVDVLRAQHEWRTKTSENQRMPKPNDITGIKSGKGSTFSAMMKACDLYIRNGTGAPPNVLEALIARRQLRSESRICGMESMHSVIKSLTFHSAIHDAVIFLRPSFRGFTAGERESREEIYGGRQISLEETNGEMNVESRPYRVTVRHHYLKGLEGCNNTAITGVQRVFASLYQLLADKLADCVNCFDFQLGRAIICAWSLDFETLDHSFLLQSGLLKNLHSLFSAKGRYEDASNVINVSGRDGSVSLHWRPFSLNYVVGAMRSGTLTKRSLLRHIFSSPRHYRTERWLEKYSLTGSFSEIVNRNTGSSMILIYADFLKKISEKQKYLSDNIGNVSPASECKRILCLAINTEQQAISESHAQEASYAKICNIGTFAEFTFELWIHPLRLTGYSTLKSCTSFEEGNIRIELAESRLQVSINGNEPRIQRFSNVFESGRWVHIALAYGNNSMSLHIDGSRLPIETVLYSKVVSKVSFNNFQIGCTESSPDVETETRRRKYSRLFFGYLCELRIWNHQREGDLINLHFQRLMKPSDSLVGLWHLLEQSDMESCFAQDDHSNIDSMRHNAELHLCQWKHTTMIPMFDVSHISDLSWIRIQRILRCFQLICRKFLHLAEKRLLEYYEDEAKEQDELHHSLLGGFALLQHNDGPGFQYRGRESGSTSALSDLEHQSAMMRMGVISLDFDDMCRLKLREGAWILFKYLATVVSCGIQDRRDEEASSVAAMARKRRKLKSSQEARGISRQGDISLDLKHAENVSNAAQEAAAHSDLAEHSLQTLWFSMELHRKIFDIFEQELSFCSSLIQDAEGLVRSQRPPMSRSMSTPAKSGAYNIVNADQLRVFEPIEIDAYLFEQLLVAVSLSNERPTQLFLSQPNVLQHLIILLRLGSPRTQRLVQLIFRSVTSIINPQDIEQILGSSNGFIELLLDRVTESVCSASRPGDSFAAHYQSSGVANVTTESLSSPLGFRTGNIHLVQGSEGVALLRLMLEDDNWAPRVYEVLGSAIKAAGGILNQYVRIHTTATTRECQTGSIERSGDIPDARYRGLLARAVGAMCVLGAHTDCIRVGGKVQVAAHIGDSLQSGGSGDNGQGDAAIATLVHIDSKSSSARVVFDGSFENSDPVHNIQSVPLLSLSPLEEIGCQISDSFATLELVKTIFYFSSIPDKLGAQILSYPERDTQDAEIVLTQLWWAQIKSRALLTQQSILRNISFDLDELLGLEAKHDNRKWSFPFNILETSLSPIQLPSFVGLPYLQERGRALLCRLIEVATPIGSAMYKSISTLEPSRGCSKGLEHIPDNENEDDKHRRRMASQLAAMGFAVEMCIVALRKNRDDMNLSAEWLMGSEAEKYQQNESLRKKRQVKSLNVDVPTKGRSKKAKELENICGVSELIVAIVLEMFDDDPDMTMGWLMDNGVRYSAELDSLIDPIQVYENHSQENIAALENIDHTDPLLFESTAGSNISDSDNVSVRGQAEVTLAPIARESSVLHKHCVLALAEEAGHVERFNISGLSGTVVSFEPERVLMRHLDIASGIEIDEYHTLSSLRRITHMYGESLTNESSIFNLALVTENALAIHYARRTVVALISTPATDIIKVFGSPTNFVQFIKLVAASERIFSRDAERSHMSHQLESSSRARHDLPVLMPVLKRRMLQVLREEIKDEEKFGDSNSVAGKNERSYLLSSVLVQECVSHFVESTKSPQETCTQDTVSNTYQSLHPYYHSCNYSNDVHIPNAAAVRVIFDRRCNFGAKTTLTFFMDSEEKHKVVQYDAESCRSADLTQGVLIHASRFWYRFQARETSTDTGYGFRFHVCAVTSTHWSRESDVSSKPSLEWACWVLSFLLNEAKDLVYSGAVHNREVYNALVRYLRSPGAPHKNGVISLLTQLLSEPELFSPSQLPELDELADICSLVLLRAEAEKSSQKLILPTRLLQLVELSIVGFTASDYFKQEKMICSRGREESAFRDAFDSIANNSLRRYLGDSIVLMRFLLNPEKLRRDLAMEVLLPLKFKRIVESAHPYIESDESEENLTYNGATVLKLWFDPRCKLSPGASLHIQAKGAGMSSEQRSVIAEQTGVSLTDIVSDRIFGDNAEDSSLSAWPERSIVLIGDTLRYKFTGGVNDGHNFGFAFTVSPIPPADSEHALNESRIEDLNELSLFWKPDMDAQLTDWVNAEVEANDHEKSVDLEPYQIRLSPDVDALRCSLLIGAPLISIQMRFCLLRLLNQKLVHCIEMFDLSDTESEWTNAYLLRRLGHCIFHDVKIRLLNAEIEKTWVAADAGGSARITLDRIKALESREELQIEPSVSECFFAQAFRQLKDASPIQFRKKIDSKGRLFSVKFKGEEGVDWGGVYRDGANSIVDSLFSPHFNLFILCPNGEHSIGLNRGMYLPNPMCTSPVAIQMFEFVGKLLGISLRTRADFPFLLPSLVWKEFVGQKLDRGDLEATDALLIQMLDGIRNCDADGIDTNEKFQTAFSSLDLRFTTTGCSGQEVVLESGGQDVLVTYENRSKYCNMIENYRLHESHLQIMAIRKGLSMVVPMRALKLLTWQEMELLTCGSPKIEIEHWQKNTRYDGYTEDDITVQLFWKVLSSFSDKQRTDFVRFAWGRSRLPRGRWPQPFKLAKKGGRDSTRSLPVAHTCFFSVELPPYTSEEQMRSMLVATINFGLGGILMA